MTIEPKEVPGELPPAEKVPEVKTPEKIWSEQNMPKSKADWDGLRETDPSLWGNLTQANTDKMFRQNKELQEKLESEESKINNLSLELNNYRNMQREPEREPLDPPSVTYSLNNLPKDKDAWDEYFLEKPTEATDLRNAYNNRIKQESVNFEEVRATSRRSVQGEHPDMYLAELDETGQPKLNEQGKVIVKVDPASGEPIFNPNSEKGKLWIQVYEQNSGIDNNPNAPTLIMAEMERRLRAKGLEIVNQSRERESQVQDGQVISEGITPPAKTDGKFHTEEERVHAEAMIRNGLYANTEDYFKNRDDTSVGIYDENRMPQFKK